MKNNLHSEGVHLDLGCGSRPRNPFNRSRLVGCDLMELPLTEGISGDFNFVEANLFFGKLPFPDSSMDSISAFDFIEHLPRVAQNRDGDFHSPFIDLMSEIFRVLKPVGIFVASTPAFPRVEVFVDPTHVNVLTSKSHEYFCGSSPFAVRYGFKGRFDALRVCFEPQKNLYNFSESAVRKFYRLIEYRVFKGGCPHLTWIFRAVK
jgi:SAM-dependent methyltransferase